MQALPALNQVNYPGRFGLPDTTVQRGAVQRSNQENKMKLRRDVVVINLRVVEEGEELLAGHHFPLVLDAAEFRKHRGHLWPTQEGLVECLGIGGRVR